MIRRVARVSDKDGIDIDGGYQSQRREYAHPSEEKLHGEEMIHWRSPY
jgi:hypothetical protein